jgi:hypothetical protein
MNCPTCFGIREVLIDKDGPLVSRLRDAATMTHAQNAAVAERSIVARVNRVQPEAEE